MDDSDNEFIKSKSGKTADSKANKKGAKMVKKEVNATTRRASGANVMAHRNILVQYPMLTDTNYGVWAVKMKIILRLPRVWQAITDDEVDDECDEGAMASIA